jgi:two-component system repressor protein LuxO
MPPLRERDNDVMLIAENFLQQFSEREGRAFTGFSDDAAAAMRRYPWPGNVRQLQKAIHQMVVLHDGAQVEEAMLPPEVRSGHIEAGETGSERRAAGARSLAAHVTRREQIEPLWLVERRTIESAIELCDGNVNQAAGLLEVAPSTVYRKLQGWKKQQA